MFSGPVSVALPSPLNALLPGTGLPDISPPGDSSPQAISTVD